ncbi:hypothetical protein BC834DRAFT_840041 [Gloeopeniophorella convolvens]|nr:hypothetical protein BC834DRAFT_840041 [Gloeopeniophorella convolvens]
MPIEVNTSPSIVNTFSPYDQYPYQPGLFAQISKVVPAPTWIAHEHPIVMEDVAADRRNHQINTVYSNQPVPQGLSSFQPPPFLPRPSPLDKNASPDHSMSSDSSLSTGNASWDLADEIARLKISNGFDSPENMHGSIRTPPQSKKAVDTMVQLHDSSPLESSEASLDSGPSPLASDERLVLPNHSRVSSADTTASTQLSGSSHTLASSALGLKVGPEQRDRPHSYSGGLSAADLQRLRGVGASPPDGEQAPQWNTGVDRQGQYDQPMYPSLSSYPRQSVPAAEELQVDYAAQQRQFQPLDGSAPNAPAFNARASGAVNGAPTYRSQPARGYNPGLVAGGAYPGPPGHATHLSLGNAQQVYEMMMPSHENPAVARVQQQHNVFRATHQHSASDPLHLREAAALISGGLPPFAQPGLYPPALGPPAMGIYPNQFYSPPDAYANAGVAAQVMAAARLQSQYHTPYGVSLPGQSISPGLGSGSQGSAPDSDPNGTGPSANNRKLGLYKTELCRSWEEKGSCRYGPKCQFAHGEEEIRKVQRHPKYKTEICRTFWVSGSCPYGKRCCFIHTELPAHGAGAGADGVPPPKATETRGRSDSDPNDAPVSLLQRISAKRNQEVVTDVTYQPPSRPRTGSLKLDTSSLDQPSIKQQQNKSAYPSFAAKGLFSQANESSGGLSPGPVTAGPDLGSRQLINFGQAPKQTPARSSSNVRHSFNGTEVGLNLTPPPAAPFPAPQPETAAPRVNGHARSGSAGNWGSFSRHLAAPSPLHGPQSASPGNEGKLNTPWLSPEQSTRYAEKASAWA